MACTNNSNCNNGCGCNGYGALSTVAGPLSHCGCGCSNPQYYQNFPFYNGPCGCVDCKNHGSSAFRRNFPWHMWNNWNGCNNCNHCGSCNNCDCSNRGGWGRGGWGRGGWKNCGCNSWNHWGNWNNCGCATVTAGDCSGAAHFVTNSSMMVEAGGTVPLSAELCSSDFEVCADGSILIHRPGTYMAIHSLHVPALQTLSTQMFLTLNGSALETSAQDVSRIADGTTGGSTKHTIFRAWPHSELRLISSRDISVNDSQDCTNAFSLTLVRLD